MEFHQYVNEIFENPISKIDHTLLPSGFSGDSRDKHALTKIIANIIDSMGVASAKSLNLGHPITSSEKLRSGDHLLYLMVDHNDFNGAGSVVGLLKIATKNLFLFDGTGKMHEKKCLCVLDFYIHESKQRQGYGKQLFEYMLRDKNIDPSQLALDKPSNKFLSFLRKYYGLSKMYPQNNNFLVFEGLFKERTGTNEDFEATYGIDTFDNVSKSGMSTGQENNRSIESKDYCPIEHGRYTAYRPHDSIEKGPSSEIDGRHGDPNHHTALW